MRRKKKGIMHGMQDVVSSVLLGKIKKG
jgi:hypothetical protein